MSDNQRKPPLSGAGEALGSGLGRARELLDRIGRLAREAKDAAEGLAEGIRGRSRGLRGLRGSRTSPKSESRQENRSLSQSSPQAEANRANRANRGTVPEAEPEPRVDRPSARVVLLARDPMWLFCYWDLDPAWRGVRPEGGRLTLRLHDVTDIEFTGANGWSQHLYPVADDSRWWHVPVPHLGRHYLAELGYCTPAGTFTSLGRSGGVATIPHPPEPGGELELGQVDLEAPLPTPSEDAPAPGSGALPTRRDAAGATAVHRAAAGPHEPPPGSSPGRAFPSSPAHWSSRR